MTDMPGITSNAARTATASTTASAPSVDYGAFLQLLVAQLKNQDPSKPMDSTQYMAQLASFSQVEQTIYTFHAKPNGEQSVYDFLICGRDVKVMAKDALSNPILAEQSVQVLKDCHTFTIGQTVSV
jgi:flagellar hook assembly protein FlgD